MEESCCCFVVTEGRWKNRVVVFVVTEGSRFKVGGRVVVFVVCLKRLNTEY